MSKEKITTSVVPCATNTFIIFITPGELRELADLAQAVWDAAELGDSLQFFEVKVHNATTHFMLAQERMVKP